MIIAEDGYVIRPCRGDWYAASEVKAPVVKDHVKSNRVAVCRRDNVGAWARSRARRKCDDAIDIITDDRDLGRMRTTVNYTRHVAG